MNYNSKEGNTLSGGADNHHISSSVRTFADGAGWGQGMAPKRAFSPRKEHSSIGHVRLAWQNKKSEEPWMQGHSSRGTFAELSVGRELCLERQSENFHISWCLGDEFLLDRRPLKNNWSPHWIRRRAKVLTSKPQKSKTFQAGETETPSMPLLKSPGGPGPRSIYEPEVNLGFLKLQTSPPSSFSAVGWTVPSLNSLNSHAGVLSPRTSNVTLFGGRVFTEKIKLKWCLEGRP